MAAIFLKLFFVSVLLLQAWHITLVACCPSVSVARGFTTKDMELEVGSPFRIQCSLFSTNMQFKNTTYNVSSENLVFKFKTTLIKNLTIVDELTAEYFVENANVNDTGMYSCYVLHPDINGSMPYICNTDVAVGYKPLSVENFTCISLEYYNLTCTWKLPFNSVKTDYLIYDLSLKMKRHCAQYLKHGCSWTLNSKPIYLRSKPNLSFLIIGNNSLGTSEYRFLVDHFKIVKPSAPQSAEFTNITPTSMLLHWTSPKNMMYGEFRPGLTFSIQYRPKDYPAPYKEIRAYFQNQGSLEITDLIPYTEYEFKIRCRSNVSDSDLMWSPPLTASMGTHPDVPYWAPETASSAFDIQVILGNRTLSLYWKV
ncbi:Cytokine receptor, partial [Stegodyphus mimosarum]